MAGLARPRKEDNEHTGQLYDGGIWGLPGIMFGKLSTPKGVDIENIGAVKSRD